MIRRVGVLILILLPLVVAGLVIRGKARPPSRSGGPGLQTWGSDSGANDGGLESPTSEEVGHPAYPPQPGPTVTPAPLPQQEQEPVVTPDAAAPSVRPHNIWDSSAESAAPPLDIDLSEFREEVRRIEEELKGVASSSREDLLVMYGRSSAASGQFDRAAAAYGMFLTEFGIEHPYSARIAMRQADCLVPLDLDNITVAHTAEGPKYEPTWRMQYVPHLERMPQAIAAYELAGRLAHERTALGLALYRQGWIQRVLNDWEASTTAWERCASETAGTPAAADALWLAAENRGWTGHPAAAAETLQRFAAEYPTDARAKAAADRIEVLEAEARRTPEWLVDPVASLQAEIAERAAVRRAPQVYRSVMEWLERDQQFAAQVAVGRWACTQTDWPTDPRLAAHFDLATALLDKSAGGEAERLEAAEVLSRVMGMAPSDDWYLSAGFRRAQLLHKLRRFEAADQTLDEVAERAANSVWEPVIVGERIQSFLDRGDMDRARAAFEELSETYPEHHLTEQFAPKFSSPGEEQSQ
ncbi:MAG: tetratricopeptide repeat protein [Planctomycetota bacterium]